MALAALAQSTRLAIYRTLVVCGTDGMAAGQLAAKIEVFKANISFNFNKLHHFALVDSRQDGRFVRYMANFVAMNEMLSYLTENYCAGNVCTLPVIK